MDKRFEILQNSSPVSLELLFTLDTDNPFYLEISLHHQYKDLHSHGEWFKLSPSDIDNIKNLAKE